MIAMGAVDDLKAENERLRAQIEAQRLRELESLRDQLAQALRDVAHFKAEAERNAQLGRQIHMEAQSEIARLRRAEAPMPNARPLNQVPNV